MSLSAIAFLLIFTGGKVAGFFRHPVYALLTYMFVYFNIPSPKFNWWAIDVPQWRWALLSAAFVVAACILWKESLSRISVRKASNAKWLISFLLLSAFISPFGVNPSHSYQRVYDFLRYVIVFWLILKCVSDTKKYEYVVYLYTLSCFYLGWRAWTLDQRIAGRLEGLGTPDASDSNLLALLLLTSVPFVMMYILHGNRYQKIISILVAPFILNGIILCSSRGAFIALVITMVVFFILDNYGKARRKAFVIAAGTLLLFFHLMDQVYIERLLTLQHVGGVETEVETGTGRTEVWMAGLEMAKDYPLGAGGKGFQDLSRSYMPAEMLTTGNVRAAHNTYVLALVENGALGLLIFLGFIGSTFILLHRVRSKIRRNGGLSYDQNQDNIGEFLFVHTVALESALVGLLVGSIFVDRLYFEPLYWLCALAPVLHYFSDQLHELTVSRQEISPSRDAVMVFPDRHI